MKTVLLNYHIKKTTVHRYLEVKSKMFNLAIANEWITKNPIKKGVKFPEKNYQIRYLTEEEKNYLNIVMVYLEILYLYL